jgi:subtilisin family serine protease
MMSIQTKTKYRQLRCKGCGSVAVSERTDSRWWLPGIVVLELEDPESPRRIFDPTDAAALQKLPVDAGQLRKIVDPLLIKQPEWTFAFKRDQPPTEKDYERFITLHLQPDVDVPAIAKELSNVGGVRRAAGEPRLAPPRRQIPYYEPRAEVEANMLAEAAEVPLLDEPLAVSGGKALGKSIQVGSELLRNQWYLFRSQADVVVKSGITGAGVVVADIDWGFKVDHQEFANGKIKFTHNAVNGTDIVSTGLNRWHGTATLGLIGAGDNNQGMLGFAPGADLWAIQAQADDAPVDNSNWAKAIEKARLTPSPNKRKVILVEAATDVSRNVEASVLVREPIKQAIANNCVVCVTAGNAGEDAGLDENGDPIDETGSILVGATQYKQNPDLVLRAASNWGARVVVSAPGEMLNDVTCCDCGVDRYMDNFGGTSGAGAKVAGAMALLLQAFPTVTHQQIVEVMKTKMPQISSADEPIGCFLDIKKLMAEVDSFLLNQ